MEVRSRLMRKIPNEVLASCIFTPFIRVIEGRSWRWTEFVASTRKIGVRRYL